MGLRLNFLIQTLYLFRSKNQNLSHLCYNKHSAKLRGRISRTLQRSRLGWFTYSILQSFKNISFTVLCFSSSLFPIVLALLLLSPLYSCHCHVVAPSSMLPPLQLSPLVSIIYVFNFWLNLFYNLFYCDGFK